MDYRKRAPGSRDSACVSDMTGCHRRRGPPCVASVSRGRVSSLARSRVCGRCIIVRRGGGFVRADLGHRRCRYPYICIWSNSRAEDDRNKTS